MAFFGLTALGAQNPFGSLLKDHAILNIFSEDDFHGAFDKVSSGGSFITLVLESGCIGLWLCAYVGRRGRKVRPCNYVYYISFFLSIVPLCPCLLETLYVSVVFLH